MSFLCSKPSWELCVFANVMCKWVCRDVGLVSASYIFLLVTEQHTKCSNRAFVLLKMGIKMPETC